MYDDCKRDEKRVRPARRRRADGKELLMLKVIDPLLGPDLLYILRAMGHGDKFGDRRRQLSRPIPPVPKS